MPADVVARLVALTGGNPLGLLELPASLTGEQLAGRVPLDDRLPLPARLERVFGERVRRLPTAVGTLLLVAAAEETGDPVVILAATARLTGSDGSDALDAAERAGLVHVGAAGVAFRHPLVRSAAYQLAGSAERRAAHRALAETYPEPDRADEIAWHRAAAALGPDEAPRPRWKRSAAPSVRPTAFTLRQRARSLGEMRRRPVKRSIPSK